MVIENPNIRTPSKEILVPVLVFLPAYLREGEDAASPHQKTLSLTAIDARDQESSLMKDREEKAEDLITKITKVYFL